MTTSKEAIIVAQQLTKHYLNTEAVRGIDFEVFRGECLGVLGPNGAGKTTTLEMVLGLTLPTSGNLSVLGYKMPEQARDMHKVVGVVPQMDNLDSQFTVYENMRSYASYFGFRGETLARKIDELLEFVALQDKAKTDVQHLSGGMRRRLTLARALINDPDLLILDEPTTGLDPQARQLLWQRIRDLRKQGKTIIVTTHYLDEAERLCDRVLVVDHGKILTAGSPVKLIQEHIEPHVIEIHGETVDSWYEARNNLPQVRIERVGGTLFCYYREEESLLPHLDDSGLEYLHRRANLEDVFLKITGRELRD